LSFSFARKPSPLAQWCQLQVGLVSSAHCVSRRTEIGIARYIVSPSVVEVIIQEHRWKQAEFERRARSESLDNLPGSLIFFVGVRTSQVEVELIGLSLGEEISAAGEQLQIKELIFDQTMHGFDIALVGVGSGRDAQMLTVAQSGGETRAMPLRIVTANEFAAVVGLPSQIAQIHAPTIQVLLNASRKDGAGCRRTLLSKGPEEQTAAHFPRRIFDQGQVQALGLGPELRNVTQILGIGGDWFDPLTDQRSQWYRVQIRTVDSASGCYANFVGIA